MAAASVSAVVDTINGSLVGSDYSCKTVSWDDALRGEGPDGLSCFGGNITDTCLYAKDGRLLFTVRSDNWNEKLGRIGAGDLTMLVHEADSLTTVTLDQYLKQFGEFGAYAGAAPGATLDAPIDELAVSIRFQTTFLPLAEGELVEFTPEAFNYNTTNDADPRNMVLLCTTQGTAVQQDGSGPKKLYHHTVDGDGKVHRHWLEAEATKHKVGAAQKESAAEKAVALACGKSTSLVIGIPAMDTRFNAVMTVQVPLVQEIPEYRVEPMSPSEEPVYRSMGVEGDDDDDQPPFGFDLSCGAFDSASYGGFGSVELAPRVAKKPKRGKSSSARVSIGTEHDTWDGLLVPDAARHEKEHVTVTVVIYNVVVGGVPSAEDVRAAADDMDSLYAACGWVGHLADEGAAFMKAEMATTEPLHPPN